MRLSYNSYVPFSLSPPQIIKLLEEIEQAVKASEENSSCEQSVTAYLSSIKANLLGGKMSASQMQELLQLIHQRHKGKNR